MLAHVKVPFAHRMYSDPKYRKTTLSYSTLTVVEKNLIFV